MLTRLQVSGFKNLVDVDVRFGPFTCIAGVNGVGKSNLFDAIAFLRALADSQLVDAARSVRDETGRTGDVLSLFHRVGHDYAHEMSFTADLLIPREGVDDLGQSSKAAMTFLQYTVVLAYRGDEALGPPGPLELIAERLEHFNLTDARTQLFPHSAEWRRSAIVTSHRTSPLISTEGDGATRVIKLHQENRQGRPLARLAANLPRTMLSAANAAEHPTALLARNEMRSWRLLHLEPLRLRQSDEFNAPTTLEVDGSHLPATLYHLAHAAGRNGDRSNGEDEGAERVYARVANRLSELIGDVRAVTVDRDEKRELLTLQVVGHDGTPHSARALSDGTLRFLALAVLAEESDAPGVLCLEEPENGIHPARIPAMLQLLQDIAVDPRQPVGPDNPLRQVVVNTHSPAVVTQVPEESLVVAALRERTDGRRPFRSVDFRGLSHTWRQKLSDEPGIALGELLAYLNPAPLDAPAAGRSEPDGTAHPARRVIDRDDIQPLVSPPAGHE